LFAGGIRATQTGTAGTTGNAGNGAAGTTGVAGTQGTAGTTGVAGVVGTAGTTGAAGDPQGVAGTTGISGQSGSGPAGSGPGGSGAAGSGGGNGGSMAGRGGAAGGMAGRGGAGGTTGGTGPGGSGGSAPGGSGGGGLISIPELFPTSGTIGSFDGRLLVMPCGDANATGTDCGGGGAYYSTAGSSTATRIACSGSALNVNQVFYVGGETGKMYDVTVHFYGIAEPKIYANGTANPVTREAGTGRPANTTTTTGAGATPTPWATAAGGHSYPASDYNTNEIRVCRTRACATSDETNVYYLNADTGQGHWTFVINYEKHITVVGGGAIRVRNYDQNCRQIKNCGPDGTPADQCDDMSNRRVVDIAAANPKPSTMPASNGGLLQPQLVNERDSSSAGQWLLIDVVSINSVQ
jgi:hypothetical protein